jgi:AbrB family looped-hinge helix DNA binding protein
MDLGTVSPPIPETNPKGRGGAAASGKCPGPWISIEFLTFFSYFLGMQATLTSKGQITIPIDIRNRLHLKPGDILEFDETSPFLKATKAIPAEAWEQFGTDATDPWAELSIPEVLDQLRGPVELPSPAQP